MIRRALRLCGRVGVTIAGAGLAIAAVVEAQEGFQFDGDSIVISRSQDWAAWTKPEHATTVDEIGDLVRPRLVKKQTDAIADMDRFSILIGDQKALTKLGKDVKREGGVVPLNIRSQAASVAGVPILYLKDKAKDGIKAGDPIEWFYYFGGIREVPRNAESAPNILDGDLDTYWEPTTEVTRTEWQELSKAKRGPVIYVVTGDDGEERRVDEAEYNGAPRGGRRVEYHSHDLSDWYVDIELGRVVPVRRIVLRFVDPEVGEPFRQFRILGTASHFRDASLGLIARTNTPNTDKQTVTFDLDGSGLARQTVSSGHPSEVATEFDLAAGSFVQLHRLRIAVTDSRFDKFKRLESEAEYLALPLEDRGSIEYHIVNAAGTETRVNKQIYDQVSDDRKGSLVYHQRERPRLAAVEVWTQGDNISLGVIDGGGSTDLTGTFAGAPGFDGLYESNYLQLVWSPDARFADRGIMTLDLGARFWLDFFRMVGSFSGVDEVVTWVSDGGRDPNGNLRFTEIDRDPSGQGRSDIEISLDEPMSVRFVRTQIFSAAAGRAGGYNTGDRVRELQIFGEGFPSEITLTSPMIEVPAAAFLGAIEWEADIPDLELTEVEIRTRTGDRLVEVTEYYGSGGEPKTETDYNKLPTSFKGPIATRQVPGGGWSPWSQRYLVSGERVTSPGPRKFLQIQVRLLSETPDLAATLHSLRVELLPAVALSSVAEVWPSEVQLGESQDFELYVRPIFVERDPQGTPSGRFNELLINAAPIQKMELLHVTIGDAATIEDGTAQQFSELATRTDPTMGAPTNWFEDPDGTLFQALVHGDTGDTLKILQGLVLGGPTPLQEIPELLLRLPRKVTSLPDGEGTRTYYRRIVAEGEEVPVDENGRLLNELTYLNLPIDQQGQVLHFEITGRTADGEVRQRLVDDFDYRALPDSAQGEIRYFRKLVGTGGEFPFNRDGERLTESAYNRLSAERGSVQGLGELVRISFRANVLLNGTTIDVSIRDSEGESAWQQVDPGDATTVRPSTGLSIAVPFSRQVVRDLEVEPRAFSPNDDGVNDQTEIRFSVANVNVARQIEVRIYDLSGQLVWHDERMTFGNQSFVWDGSDRSGHRVAPGLYLCRVEVDADSEGASRRADHRVIAVAY